MSFWSELDPTNPHGFMGQWVTPMIPPIVSGKTPDNFAQLGNWMGEQFGRPATPENPLAPAQTAIAGNIANLLQNQPTPTYFPGQTYANFDPLQQRGQSNLVNWATNGAQNVLTGAQGGYNTMMGQLNPSTNPILSAAQLNIPGATNMQNSIMNFAGGIPGINANTNYMNVASPNLGNAPRVNIPNVNVAGYANPNPALSRLMSGGINPILMPMGQAAVNQATRGFQNAADIATSNYARDIFPQLAAAQSLPTQAARSFLEQIAPGIRSSAINAGQYGGSRQGLATGLAASRIGEELARQTGNIGLAATLGGGGLSQQLGQAAGQVGQSLGDTLANLYGGAYESGQNRAAQAASTAAGLQLGTGGQLLDLARLGADIGTTNAGLQQQRDITGANLGLEAQRANQAAQMQGAQLGLQGQTANEAALLARMGLGGTTAQNIYGNYGNAYGQGLNALTSGLNFAPSLMNLGMMPGNILNQVGGQRQAMNQAGINEDIARFNFNQNAPWMNTERAAQIAGMMPQPQQQLQPNTGMQWLGLGLQSIPAIAALL